MTHPEANSYYFAGEARVKWYIPSKTPTGKERIVAHMTFKSVVETYQLPNKNREK